MTERKGAIVNLFNEQCGFCCYCSEKMTLKLGKKRTATIEHITPKSKGGKNILFNYAAACYECNSERGNSPLLIYLFSKKYGNLHCRPKPNVFTMQV
jgi:5-methylcytosine-specific restriction endonuclease McrA